MKQKTIAQTHKTATEHLKLLATVLDSLHDLEAHSYYAEDHYLAEINSIRTNIARICTQKSLVFSDIISFWKSTKSCESDRFNQ